MIVAPDRVRSSLGDRPVLAEICNPFGQVDGMALVSLLKSDPDAGASQLDQLVADVREQMESALAQGAEGIFYRVHGARGELTTPMEYGGFFLERDRELLDHVSDAPLNVAFIVGDEDVYVDFVSDLPAAFLAWDSKASGLDAAYVRTMRTGALASADPASDMLLITGVASVASQLDRLPQAVR
jgi:hypothetical protein